MLALLSRSRDFTAARRSGVGVGGGADDLALGNSDWIGSAPPLPSRVASSSAAACRSSRQGSPPKVELQRARASRNAARPVPPDSRTKRR